MAEEPGKRPAALGPATSAPELDGQEWALRRRIEDVFAKLGEKFGDLTGRVEVTFRPEMSFDQIGGLAEAKAIIRSFAHRPSRTRSCTATGGSRRPRVS